MTTQVSVGAPRYTREIHTHGAGQTGHHTQAKSLNSLKNRHKLLRTAQAILYRDGIEPKRQHRAVWCHRHVITEFGIPIFRRHDGLGARMAKVKTCGSVWACPVCSAKVSETRRRELNAAMVMHTSPANVGPIQPGTVKPTGCAYLVTFTFPHSKNQSLADLMAPFEKARQSFQNSRKWKALTEAAGKIGVVNSLEVTYGAANGWHPHLHMLMFCNQAAFGEGAADESGRLNSAKIEHMRGEWVRQLEKRGLVDMANRGWANTYALDIRGGQQAAEYIAKWGHDESWGMSSELTSAHAKTGKRSTWGAADHYTPFQLLALAKDGDGHAICAYREFVKEFDGRRMLTWSRGLKAHFKIDEIDDLQAATEQELALPDEHQIGEIQAEQLQVLTKYGRIGDFLAFVAEHGYLEEPQQLIDEWIAAIDRAGGKHGRGDVLVDQMIEGNGVAIYKARQLAA